MGVIRATAWDMTTSTPSVNSAASFATASASATSSTRASTRLRVAGFATSRAPASATRPNLVAAGRGVTTVPPSLLPAVPSGVRVVTVRGGPDELRRIQLAWPPGRLTEPAGLLADALATACHA